MTTQHVSWSYTTCWHKEVMWKTRKLKARHFRNAKGENPCHNITAFYGNLASGNEAESQKAFNKLGLHRPRTVCSWSGNWNRNWLRQANAEHELVAVLSLIIPPQHIHTHACTSKVTTVVNAWPLVKGAGLILAIPSKSAKERSQTV